MDTPTSNDPLSMAISLYPTLKAFAAAVGVDYQVVQSWRRNRVPAKYCPVIEKVTKGAVRREDLRPEIYPRPVRRSKKAATVQIGAQG